MSPRNRRRQLSTINHRWTGGMAIAIVAVVVGLICIALGGKLVYVGLPLAGVAAVGAMILTITRTKAGDDIDEAEL